MMLLVMLFHGMEAREDNFVCCNQKQASWIIIIVSIPSAIATCL
jgi:hypothetical protein